MDFDDHGRIITDHIALPSTMADLLEAAINDARKLDRNTYVPNHGQWHRATDNNSCKVCLAGSLIAGTLSIGATYTVSANSFNTRTKRLLIALDNMRIGHWTGAFYHVYYRYAGASLRKSLKSIPTPNPYFFTGWPGFQLHLDSLEQILPRLRQIDRIWKKSALT